MGQSYFSGESERLTYRKLTESDISTWAEFFDGNDRLHFLALIDNSKSHEDISREWIERQVDRYETQGCGMLGVCLKDSGKLIGLCGIIERDYEEKKIFEIGYSFMRSVWGNGYATESARHFKQIGVDLDISPKFVSMIHPENFDSMKVAERNGMKPLATSIYMDMEVIIYGDEGAI